MRRGKEKKGKLERMLKEGKWAGGEKRNDELLLMSQFSQPVGETAYPGSTNRSPMHAAAIFLLGLSLQVLQQGQ